MLQSENEDYDDRFLSAQVRTDNKIALKRAGTFWMIVWAWFLMGVCFFGGIEMLTSGVRIGIAIFILAHVILAGVLILGGYYVRKGYGMLISILTTVSPLLGVCYGGGGLCIGGFMMVDFLGAMDEGGPNVQDQVQGAMLALWSGLFLLMGLVALFLSFRCAILSDE